MKSDIENDISEDEEPGPECLRAETERSNLVPSQWMEPENAESDDEGSDAISDVESGES